MQVAQLYQQHNVWKQQVCGFEKIRIKLLLHEGP
jgi:hypothetical protein